MENPFSTSRLSSIHLFSGIVKDNYKKLILLEKRINEIEKNRTKLMGEDEAYAFEKKLAPLQHDFAKLSLIVVVFSAMLIESYIYDYAARIWAMDSSVTI